MDYQYFEEESDYIDLDEEEEDDDVETAGSLDHRFGQPNSEDDYYFGGEDEMEELVVDGHGVLELAGRLLESLQSCVQPSVLQVMQYVAPMLLLCLLCRLLCLLYSQRRRLTSLAPLHLFHFACGLIILQLTVGYRLLLLLLLAAVGYLLLQLLRLGRRGAQVLAVLTVGSQFLYELLIWRRRSDWPQLRGIQMVVNMKLISLGFDLTASGQLQRCRYSHCPSKRRFNCLSYWLVRLTNLAFTALAIFHLAYLGVVLLGDGLEGGEDGDSFLWHWQQAGYLSHYIGLGTFVLYLFIS
ncbi:GD15644 [Drosophila simulans]|uniref:GD15644 n=1 Tax=Drosophila simulans TaxID=7240 RepID=B4R6Y6_DROSI|nr:GD15644 [Drosophila simulans]